MSEDAQLEFDRFSEKLSGLPVSHIWRGHGSALFLEFGRLHKRKRRDSSEGNAQGQMTLMIEWSWRIEGPRSILVGSWSEESKWPATFKKLLKTAVSDVACFGRLNEIDVTLSNGHHVVSFSTTDGQPQWALIDRDTASSLFVRRGVVVKEKSLDNQKPL